MSIADQSRWKYVLCNLDGEMPPGSGALYNTSNKEFTYMINSARTAQVSVAIDNPQVDYAFTNDCLMKVYRQNRYGSYQLFMVGDVMSVEETAQNDTGMVTITAADPFWRIQHRLLGVLSDSYGRGIPYLYGYESDNVTPEPIEIGLACLLTLNFVNLLNYTGVAIGSTTGVTTSTYGPAYAAYLGDIIQQSCSVLGGPDFSIIPCEPTGGWPNTKIGTMNFYSHLGAINPFTNAVFEYGIGLKNVLSYDRLKTKANIANNVLSLPQGFPSGVASGDGVINQVDAPSFTSITEFDYVLDSGDTITDETMRRILMAETISVLGQAQNQITFQPSVDCELEFGTDYGVGDIVIARAYDQVSGSMRYNGTARVYGVDIQVSDTDQETATLTLIPSSISGGGTSDY